MSGRSRRGKPPQLIGYMTANMDCREKSFVQVGDSLLKDKRVHALSHGARNLFLCLADEARGKWEVPFSGKTAEEYGFRRSSYDRYIKELIRKGFIAEVDDGEHLQYWKRSYKFLIDWKRKPIPPDA